MGEKSAKKATGEALARVLRNSKGATTPQQLEQQLYAGRPFTPSAEYVARANQAMGREFDGAAYMEGVRQEEREHGGMYGTRPLAPGASARLPADPFPKAPVVPQLSAEQVAMAKQAGTQRVAPDPRMLAAALRSRRPAASLIRESP